MESKYKSRFSRKEMARELEMCDDSISFHLRKIGAKPVGIEDNTKYYSPSVYARICESVTRIRKPLAFEPIIYHPVYINQTILIIESKMNLKDFKL